MNCIIAGNMPQPQRVGFRMKTLKTPNEIHTPPKWQICYMTDKACVSLSAHAFGNAYNHRDQMQNALNLMSTRMITEWVSNDRKMVAVPYLQIIFYVYKKLCRMQLRIFASYRGEFQRSALFQPLVTSMIFESNN